MPGMQLFSHFMTKQRWRTDVYISLMQIEKRQKRNQNRTIYIHSLWRKQNKFFLVRWDGLVYLLFSHSGPL